jgi:hypothetical protein
MELQKWAEFQEIQMTEHCFQIESSSIWMNSAIGILDIYVSCRGRLQALCMDDIASGWRKFFHSRIVIPFHPTFSFSCSELHPEPAIEIERSKKDATKVQNQS